MVLNRSGVARLTLLALGTETGDLRTLCVVHILSGGGKRRQPAAGRRSLTNAKCPLRPSLPGDGGRLTPAYWSEDVKPSQTMPSSSSSTSSGTR